MASDQLRKDAAAASDKEDIHMVSGEVPLKVAHFTSLAQKAADGDDHQTQTRKNESKEVEGVGSKEEERQTLDAQQKTGEAVKALGVGERYQQVKDKIGQGAETTSQYLSEKVTPMKNTLLDKTKQAKDTITTTAAAQTAQQETGSEVKETTVGTVQKIGGYVGEKAVAAKDMAVGAGKTTVGYTGKVAVDARDRAVVAGWGVANYTTEKTVAATKAAADAVGGVAGYVGGKAAGAKDTVTGYVGEKLVNAKDAVISAEESLAEYTARKKAEAETNKCRGVGINDGKGEGEGGDMVEGMIKGSEFTVGGDDESKGRQRKEKDGEGVFQAIGDTLVEIVQGTSKPPFVVGPDQGYSGGKVIEKEE